VTTEESLLEVLLHRVTDKRDFKPTPFADKVLGHSLIAATDQNGGRKLRRVLNPAFKNAKLSSIIPVFADSAQIVLNKWDESFQNDGGVVDITAYAKKLTFEVIGKAGFGFDFQNLTSEDNPERKAIETTLGTLFHPIEWILGNRIFSLIWAEKDRKRKVALATTRKLISEVIVQRKKMREAENYSTEHEYDLLDHILEADTANELTQEELIQNVYLFFIAGYDTSSSVLQSLMYMITTKHECRNKLIQEIDEELQGNRPDVESLSRLTYLDAMMKEVMRLFPPFFGLLTRVANHDMILDGYTIPKGTSLYPNLLPIHLSEKIWGPDALEFIPERWIGPEASKHTLYSFAIGPRVCLGKRFAFLEIKTIVCMLLQKYTWRLTPGWTWVNDLNALSTQPASPLTVILEPRKKNV